MCRAKWRAGQTRNIEIFALRSDLESAERKAGAIDIDTAITVNTEAELDRIARHHRGASGVGMQFLNALGVQADGLLGRLPAPVRDGLDTATERALRVALSAAQGSRKAVPDQPDWVNRTLTTAMGAAGGFGGLPSALVELPVTTTVLMRTIQGVAVKHGFDPAEDSVRFDCLQVFASAGPLSDDDDAELGFLTLRLALSGGAIQKLIALVAPRLAVVLGQKLAAQTVPVLGAVAGAGTNYVFTSYYTEMAHVHFGLRRLAVDAGVSEQDLTRQLLEKLQSRQQ